MEKITLLVPRILVGILLFLNPIFDLGAEVARLPLYGKGNYLSWEDLAPFFPEIRKTEDPILGLVQLTTPQGTLRFRAQDSFYTLDGKIEKIPKKILTKNGLLYLPLDVIEALLQNLIAYDVRYRSKATEFLMEVPKEPSPKKEMHVKAIIIDPGHGGKDPGTSDSLGNYEKTITLAVGRYLFLYLRKYYPEIRVIITRKTDTFLELEERSRIANRLLRDTRDSLFVSLHCNASLSERANGFEVYYLSQTANSEQARETALLENKFVGNQTIRQVGVIQSQMLSSITQRRSRRLAENIAKEYSKGLPFPGRGTKKADFSVLRGSLMPAVLVEMGYLTNFHEAKSLQDKEMQKQIARAILKGIRQYTQDKDD